MEMAPPTPLHRHQSSLEGIIDFTEQPSLTPAQRLSATRRFHEVINHFDHADRGTRVEDYDRVKLVKLTFDYARSEESKGRFLCAFFQFAQISIDGNEIIDLDSPSQEAQLRDSLFNFADYLFENFFLPLKASTKKTPQHTPASHPVAQGEGHSFPGTPTRLSNLRGLCLTRDRYRCVISRQFDRVEASKRFSRGGEPRDDDGISLRGQAFALLEVAHILPHSLTQANTSKQLDPTKEAALAILNMFDSGAAFLIEGPEIDRPHNAMTLTTDLHQAFGDFKVFFEPVRESEEPHTYRIDTFQPWLWEGILPVTRTLYLTEFKTIDPPLPRLLAIHSAIAHILHLSAAGDYIDRILEDLEHHGVREDGSTQLDQLIKLRLGGWSVGEVNS